MTIAHSEWFIALGYWFINTAGIGGIIVTGVFLTLLLVYARVLRWVHEGGETDEITGGKPHAHA